MPRSMKTEKTKDKHIRIKYGGEGHQSSMRVEHPWSGSFVPIQRFQQFRDKLEALCGLPRREELPRILELSTASALPPVWHRARLSALEEKAIDIFSVLIFTSKKHWRDLLREFFQQERWQVDLRGRPTLDLRDKELRYVKRGLEIERAIARLTPGHQIKVRAKKNKGYGSGEEQMAEQLKARGFDEREVEAIVNARSAQDSALRYFFATQKGVHVSRKSIRNDYAKFKSWKKRFPQDFLLYRS
jgi:hypothetical protein